MTTSRLCSTMRRGFFDDHFGDLHMALGRFIEGGADHFGAACRSAPCP